MTKTFAAFNPVFFFILFGCAIASCRVQRSQPETKADNSVINYFPPAPDYANESNWAALPSKKDSADAVPFPLTGNGEDTARVDVFFVHPTTFTSGDGWNADVKDEELNRKTDKGTLRNQASVFNGSCKVYAPRYRQAHLKSYWNLAGSGKIALDTAYADVKRAFDYYLAQYNNGRPFIIASHSQGSTHTIRLLHEEIEGKEIEKKLVAAYVIGMSVKPNSFSVLTPCVSPSQTDCFCSWCTYACNYYPPYYGDGMKSAIVVNPLSWTTDSTHVTKDCSRGMLDFNFNMVANCTDAQIHAGMLWIHKPKFPGSRLIHIKNYHIADYNLFWMDIRLNVAQRVSAYFLSHPN